MMRNTQWIKPKANQSRLKLTNHWGNLSVVEYDHFEKEFEEGGFEKVIRSCKDAVRSIREDSGFNREDNRERRTYRMREKRQWADGMIMMTLKMEWFDKFLVYGE